jgi:hypothetical protein
MFVNGHRLPSPVIVNNKYILSAEYAWYMIGEEDRKALRDKKNSDHSDYSEKEAEKIKDVLSYRSPTETQLKWILDWNRFKVIFPQTFWDFSLLTVDIKPEGDGFKYKLGTL